jgi:hypothetical protein
MCMICGTVFAPYICFLRCRSTTAASFGSVLSSIQRPQYKLQVCLTAEHESINKCNRSVVPIVVIWFRGGPGKAQITEACQHLIADPFEPQVATTLTYIAMLLGFKTSTATLCSICTKLLYNTRCNECATTTYHLWMKFYYTC